MIRPSARPADAAAAPVTRPAGRPLPVSTHPISAWKEVGDGRPVPDAVASAAADLVALAGRAAALREKPARRHVALVHRPRGLRLLVQDEAANPALPPSADPLALCTRSWGELLSVAGGMAGGGIDVEHVAGWGTDGLSDRAVAARLVISPETVEKHVGAVLRKTGVASRTAAVRRALERGWLPEARARSGSGRDRRWGTPPFTRACRRP